MYGNLFLLVNGALLFSKNAKVVAFAMDTVKDAARVLYWRRHVVYGRALVGQQALNCSSTILWHLVAVPDDYHSPMPRRNPEDIDLGAIKTDLEFLIERVSRLPSRKEQALRPLYVMVGSAGIVIAWIELFWRHCL